MDWAEVRVSGSDLMVYATESRYSYLLLQSKRIAEWLAQGLASLDTQRRRSPSPDADSLAVWAHDQIHDAAVMENLPTDADIPVGLHEWSFREGEVWHFMILTPNAAQQIALSLRSDYG